MLLFLASDLSAFVTGHTIPTDGGTAAAGGWFRSESRPGREWTAGLGRDNLTMTPPQELGLPVFVFFLSEADGKALLRGRVATLRVATLRSVYSRELCSASTISREFALNP